MQISTRCIVLILVGLEQAFPLYSRSLLYLTASRLLIDTFRFYSALLSGLQKQPSTKTESGEHGWKKPPTRKHRR
jgi:hypothetical protein